MEKDVFLSFSSLDLDIAKDLYDKLIKNGISCWFSEETIPLGDRWEKKITEAIKSCKILILVFSKNANQSLHIEKEIGIGSKYGRFIIPIRVDNTTYNDTLEYHLSGIEHIDAFGERYHVYYAKLLSRIKEILEENSNNVPQNNQPVMSQGLMKNTSIFKAGWKIQLLLVFTIMFIIMFFYMAKKDINLYNHFKIESVFIPSGWMGDAVEDTLYVSFDPNHKNNPYSGNNCIRIEYTSGPLGWAGIYWLFPENNWGEKPGYNLSENHFSKITFYARSEIDGAQAIFKVGGISKLYKDSFPVESISVFLTKNWEKYEIPLKSADLSSVIGGFCWVSNSNIIIYLDEIQFE